MITTIVFLPLLFACCTILAPCVLFVVTNGSRFALLPRSLVSACIAWFNLLIIPWYIHDHVSTITKVMVIFLYGWLATFKSIGSVIHRGPLCSCKGNLAHFILVYNLPITPVWKGTALSASSSGRGVGNARQHESKERSIIGWFIQLLAKLTMLLCVTGISARIDEYYTNASKDRERTVNEYLTSYHEILPLPVQCLTELCDALGLYAFIGVIMNISSFLLQCLPYGMSIKHIAPHYDKPWLSKSITDFWSSRWNLNTGYTLRYLVYDPICEGQLLAPMVRSKMRPGRIRRAIAMCAAFFVSGIMHEVFIYHMRSQMSGYWLAYFAVQGPLILVVDEFLGLKKLVIYSIVLARVLTLSIQLAVAHVLFFPDIVRMGIPMEIHGNVRNAFGLILPTRVYSWVYADVPSNVG